MSKGQVTLVGAGPGDPGLLTLKGAHALKWADVVVYDRLVSPAVLARIPENAEKIDVGKESGSHPVPQQKIQEILRDKALAGKRVVRLKGGDPFLFGRGGEELAFLAAYGIPFSEIPGIPSAIAAPAYAGIPVTNRGASRSLHILTGHAKAGEAPEIPYKALAEMGGTLLFLMGVSTIESICGGLLAAGMSPDTPAAVVESGTLPVQRRFSAPLASLAKTARAGGAHSPAVLIVGEVCVQAETLDWFSRLPLFGCRVVLTMPDNTAQPLAEQLRALGAEAFPYPCIQTVETADNPGLRTAFKDLKRYRFLVFTSRRGVDAFFHALFRAGLDARALAGCRIAAVAARTGARLSSYGIRADILPDQADGAHLAHAILQTAGPGDRALLCRSAQAAEALPGLLRAGGVQVNDIPVYETRTNPGGKEMGARFAADPPDYTVFASGSAVDGFLLRSGVLPEQVRGVCIGETTAARANARGIRCAVAEHPDFDSLVKKICEVRKNGTL